MARSLFIAFAALVLFGVGGLASASKAATVPNTNVDEGSPAPESQVSAPLIVDQPVSEGSSLVTGKAVLSVSEAARENAIGGVFTVGDSRIDVPVGKETASGSLNSLMPSLSEAFGVGFATFVDLETYSFNFADLMEGAGGGIRTAGMVLAAVPVPPALIVLGAALMGLVLFGRRRRGAVDQV